ncbi:VOC family protein [Kineococcus gynurae]|uniref:VOC family protein n=1 Tax=Kineococcus gynurae TaxID=452979 RepID=A0ABV5LX85_9ACTN
MTTVSLRYSPVVVDDMDAAVGFYRDALGLELKTDVSNGGSRWVTLGFAAQPGLELVLSEPGGGRSPQDAEALQELLTKGLLPGPLVFAVDDLDALFEQVRASGAEVLQEPAVQPWGPRDCAFRDPAGNLVRVNQAG